MLDLDLKFYSACRGNESRSLRNGGDSNANHTFPMQEYQENKNIVPAISGIIFKVQIPKTILDQTHRSYHQLIHLYVIVDIYGHLRILAGISEA